MTSYYEKLKPEQPDFKYRKNKTSVHIQAWTDSLYTTDSDSDSSESCHSCGGSLGQQSLNKSETSSESSENSIVWLPHIEPDGRLFYTDVVSERILHKKNHKEDVTTRGRLKKLLRRKRKKKKARYEDSEITVLVEITPNRHKKLSNYCQEYLGIISEPGMVQAVKTGMLPRGPIVIGGLAEGSKLAKEGQVKPGDILKSIGKHPVDHSNIELVLQQLIEPCVLAITVTRKSGLVLDKFDTQTMRRFSDEGILGFLDFLKDSGNSLENFLEFMEKYSCTCLLLSVDKVTEFSPEFADVFYEFDLYKFLGGTKQEFGLSSVRGSFLTLEKTFVEVFGNEVSRSSVDINGVGHTVIQQTWNKYTFILGMPSTWCSESELFSKASHLRSLLEFSFGSSVTALQSEKEECDWLLTVMFLTVAAKEFCEVLGVPTTKLPCCLLDDSEVTVLEESFPVTSPIPKLLKDQLDAVLFDLEACDVSTMVTSDFENDYVLIRGSLILYKNHLLCTHLPLPVTQHVYNYLNQHRILSVVRHSQVFQIVTWSEVFVDWREIQNRKEPKAENLKWSLLVLVQDHITLCALFETGSNDEKVDKLYLEPAMVEEMEFALNEAESSGIIEFLEKWFQEPELQAQDFTSKEYLAETLNRKGSMNSVNSIHSLGEPLPESKGHGRKGNKRKPLGEDTSLSDLSIVSDGSLKDVSSRLTNERRALQIIIEEKRRLSSNLGPSAFATFFALDYGRGIVLAAGEYRNESLNTQLLDRVRKHSFEVKEEFEVDLRNQEKRGSGIAVQEGVREIGRVFTISVQGDKKKSKKEVAYWICGRVSYSPFRTLTFICYEDGTSQEAIDAGLKLAFSV